MPDSSAPPEDELPLGDDAIELVRDPEAAEEAIAEDTAPVAVDEPDSATADADWIATDPITEEQRDAGPGASPGDEPLVELDDGSGDAGPGADLSDEPVAETGQRKRKSRSSVPSWDEIMFGGGKSD